MDLSSAESTTAVKATGPLGSVQSIIRPASGRVKPKASKRAETAGACCLDWWFISGITVEYGNMCVRNESALRRGGAAIGRDVTFVVPIEEAR